MSKDIKIKRGLDIRLVGEADKVIQNAPSSEVIAIKPLDFHGVVPKMLVKVGERVKAGTPVFANKHQQEVLFASPVSGEVLEIVRGEKRKILSVLIKADQENEFESLAVNDSTAESVKETLLSSGAWVNIKQRPFDVIANPNATPKSIFVSAFDSNPLAPDFDFIVKGQEADFQKGIDVLAKLTDGKVNVTYKKGHTTSEALKNVANAEVNTIQGPHPAGNVGTQIHFIDPINKGDVVWSVDLQGVIAIGRLFNTSKYDATKLVAVTGSHSTSAKYYRVLPGASVKSIVEGNVKENTRYVSGNPLTGDNVGAEGYLGYFHNQISLLPEGNQPKFVATEGWLSPGFSRFSNSRLYPTWLMGGKKYDLDTNINGEERAFVVTGEMEKVMPLDILPMHLVKSMMYKDIDEMEGLGIYEVAPEDFALCEFVNTSKINIQQIVRESLDFVKQETT